MLYKILYILVVVYGEINFKVFGKFFLDVQIMFIVEESVMQVDVGENILVFLFSVVYCNVNLLVKIVMGVIVV